MMGYSVYQVRTGTELGIAKDIGEAAFVPTLEKWVRARRGRRIRAKKTCAAFPSYIFIRQGEVLPPEVARQCRAVRAGEGVASVPSGTVDALRQKQMVEPERFKIGDRVRVTSGQLEGRIIAIESIGARTLRGVAQTMMGQMSITLPATTCLEPCDKNT